MQFITTFIVLALAGLTDAGYLTYKHRRHQALVCPIGTDCNAVVGSRWGTILGIRTEFLGAAFYLGMLAAGLSFFFFPELAPLARTGARVAAGCGVLFSAYLTYLQARVIRHYCFYCLLSALITTLLFINSWVLPLPSVGR